MPQEIHLWKVADGRLETLDPGRLDLESRLESWLERDPSMLGEDLLIIGKQVPTTFGGFIDLLAVDPNGDLVVLELKRERTPREVTAQVLDYASWVRDLSTDQIETIAASYLPDDRSLDAAFRDQFDSDLPDVLNESHRMVIVASRVDDSTERIVRYLSDEHGVNINVATFQYFSVNGAEVLARVFLLEPDQVEYRSRTRGGSNRRPPLTPEQLETVADEQGVGDLYRGIVERLDPVFPSRSTSRTALRFKGPWKGSHKVILNLIPGESSAQEGIRYQLYSHRLASLLGVEEAEVKRALPTGSEDYEYYSGAEPEYQGYTGFFRSAAEVIAFLQALGAEAGG